MYKNELLLENLNKFFDDEKNKQILIDVLNNKYNISLRIIDWFVTNYCKKYNTGWNLNNTRFVVYINYKLQLKAIQKIFWSILSRERIYFNYNDKNKLITTVGQLNFFRWMIENNIIDYIKDNYDDIEHDMQSALKNISLSNNKRRELSKSSIKSINKTESSIVLKFE